MSLDSPTYLNSLQNNIRARPIPWEGAVRAGSITEEQLRRVKAVDKVRKDQRQKAVEKDLSAYTNLLAGGSSGKSILESAARRADIIQYVLVLAGDLINDAPALKKALLEDQGSYRHFLPLLQHSSTPEDPIPLLASCFLINLISASLLSSQKTRRKDEEALPRLFSYLATLTKNADTGLQDIGVQGFSELLRTSRSRELFWDHRAATVEPLMDILRAAAGSGKDNGSTTLAGSSARTAEMKIGGGVGIQLLYHVLIVIWELSFEGKLVGDQLESDHEIIALYAHLLRISPKEKTTRLLVYTLLNILSTNKTSLLPMAVFVGLPSLLTTMGARHYVDEDLLEAMQSLSDMLEEYTKTQTTFDTYAAEVMSGHLRWSPPHKNTTFWRENARRILDEERGQLPKKLAEILSKSWETDKQVLAIACHDVGCLVREVPERRHQLEKLGLKARVMELMADRDESVRWESLRAVGEWLRYTFDN
uniref:V-type proton ATPase subunit H n=1 Tax=Coccidioides posadasii RMSCC 3488 TaxID=454284 RepID=A0A0J6FMH8_COCPO|nr:vacuolar ATP synthase subunit H [Coccidioides posadasii RMSCC 3488]